MFLDRVGGTSGPLFGLLFQALADAVTSAGSFTAEAVGDGAAVGLAAVQRVGEAEVGDKTLVDALAPAVEAMADATARGDDGFAAAAVAARRGADSTTRLRARRGRASYVGDHARGVTDPGASTVALLFEALAAVT